LKPKTLKFGDKEFYMPTVPNVENYDKFECPYCRQIVEKTFRIEDITTQDINLPYNDMVGQIMSKFASIV
jgi:hypothetical protein